MRLAESIVLLYCFYKLKNKFRPISDVILNRHKLNNFPYNMGPKKFYSTRLLETSTLLLPSFPYRAFESHMCEGRYPSSILGRPSAALPLSSPLWCCVWLMLPLLLLQSDQITHFIQMQLEVMQTKGMRSEGMRSEAMRKDGMLL